MSKPYFKSEASSGAEIPATAGFTRSETTDQILRALRLVFRSVQKHNQIIEEQCGVGGVQMWALWEISQAGRMRVSELAQKLSIHQSTTSNLLDKLERQRFIRRERSTTDQRVVQVALTENGEKLLESSPPVARNLIVDALMEMPEDSLRQLEDRLYQLIRHLKVQDASGESQPIYRL
ncbi:MAG: MarR family transcriptional regulator [Methylococcaceae bacterium]|nr:MarR family transcriptional regulator [Methylococcaceae bacterium]